MISQLQRKCAVYCLPLIVMLAAPALVFAQNNRDTRVHDAEVAANKSELMAKGEAVYLKTAPPAIRRTVRALKVRFRHLPGPIS